MSSEFLVTINFQVGNVRFYLETRDPTEVMSVYHHLMSHGELSICFCLLLKDEIKFQVSVSFCFYSFF